MSVPHHRFRNAAHERPHESSSSVRSHNDQIDVFFLGKSDNPLPCRSMN
jgi:hypothetical protein